MGSISEGLRYENEIRRIEGGGEEISKFMRVDDQSMDARIKTKQQRSILVNNTGLLLYKLLQQPSQRPQIWKQQYSEDFQSLLSVCTK